MDNDEDREYLHFSGKLSSRAKIGALRLLKYLQICARVALKGGIV
jgi:hypothetical protein